MNPSPRIWKLSAALAFVLAAAPSSTAFAQDAAKPATTTEDEKAKAAAAETPTVTEEITVTARKREESLQDVPLSMVAPTEEVLRSRGVDSLEGVANNVAGFTVQNLGPGQSQVAMRGVSSGQIARDQPGVKEQVGIYLDESVISLSLFTPDIDLFDMNRVEVLRGPQGTLFGSGSESGTVRYITNQPQLGNHDAVAELTASTIQGGGFGGSAKVAANVPFGDTSAMRIAAYYTSYGGFIDAVQPDLSTNEDVNDGDRAGVRVSFLLQPSENLKVTPRLIYQEVKMDGWNRVDAFNILANPYTTTRPAVDLGDDQQFTQIGEPFDDKFLLADLNIEYKFSEMALTSITSYTDRDVDVVRDAGALTSSITGGSIGLPENVYTLDSPLDDATKAKVITQELRLAGGNDALDWLGGVFYGNTQRDYGQSLDVAGFQTLTGIPTAGNFGAGRDILFFSDLSYDLDQFAAFGEATWAVSEKLDLTGGLRYYNFDESRDQAFDGIFADPGATHGKTSADGFAPRVVASYKVAANTAFNAQVSKGFRLGGINDPLNVPLCTPQDLSTFGGQGAWKDETLWNYEVGSKSTVMGGKGTFNVAAYYMDINDLQATVTAGSCSSRVVFNVPNAKSTGLEMEFAAATSENFDFSISASFNDSKLGSTLTSTDGSGNVSIVGGIEKGKRLPTVPKFQISAAATYQHQVMDSSLGYVTATYQHVGSRFTQSGDQADGFGIVNLNSFGANTIGGPLTASLFTFDPELPAYDVFNLRAGVLVGAWDVAVFVNNLTDEQALLSLDQERGTRARVAYLTNQPRTFGLSARVKF
ncbi:MAG: TonB-dependent receptor [Thermoanaerobaculia bacterium]